VAGAREEQDAATLEAVADAAWVAGELGECIDAVEHDAVGAGKVAERPGVRVAIGCVRRANEHCDRSCGVAPRAAGDDDGEQLRRGRRPAR
jgi:hypothetical protein